MPFRTGSAIITVLYKPKIFLSYANENLEFIQKIDKELSKYNVEVIAGYKNLRGGQDFEIELRNLIKNSGYFIPCLSTELNDKIRSYVYKELHWAIDIYQEMPPNTKWIIPVRINDCAIPDIELRRNQMLSRLHYIDLFPESNFEQSIENIIRSIGDNKLVDTKTEPKTPFTEIEREISFPEEIQVLKEIGFDMGEYRPITDVSENIDSDTEFWSQSLWFGETPEIDFKLPNYTMAIVSGNKNGKLNEIRLILTI